MFGKIKELLQNFNLKENNRPFIFLVCLLIATVLWLVKALEKQYDTSVSMPIKYTNLPLNKVLINPPPSRLYVKLKAHGFTLLRHKFGMTLSPINLDVMALSINSSDKKSPSNFFVLSDQCVSQISNQINPEITIVDISPDTLFFHYDKLLEKKVKITTRVNVTFQNNFYLSDSIKLSPDQIIVSGPYSLVDTLSCVYTKKHKFNNLSTTVEQNLSLEKIDQLEFSTYKASIKIPVSSQSIKK